MRARRSFSGFARKPPAIDGPKARAQAILFLTGARSLDHVTPEGLAASYRLSVKRAAAMLETARAQRNG